MTNNSDSSKDSDLNSDQVENDTDFGKLLTDARKEKKYTVEEVSDYLKIPVSTIIALEACDREALPASTFTRGYIRAYAKFLETSEDAVLLVYSRGMPHDNSRDLKPRSNLPDEASSQSPLIKTITLLLIIAVIAVIGIGGFQYYQKKAGVMEDELDAKQQSFTGNSLDSPGSHPIVIKQNAQLVDGELVVGEAAVAGTESIEPQTASVAVIETSAVSEDETDAQQSENAIDTQSEDDRIEIIAENGSWVEVRDANKSRLLYNMLAAGGSRELFGQAPFSVTMGNAKTTRVVVNGIEVDVSDYIRSNNTASFKVSTQDQEVIFH